MVVHGLDHAVVGGGRPAQLALAGVDAGADLAPAQHRMRRDCLAEGRLDPVQVVAKRLGAGLERVVRLQEADFEQERLTELAA